MSPPTHILQALTSAPVAPGQHNDRTIPNQRIPATVRPTDGSRSAERTASAAPVARSDPGWPVEHEGYTLVIGYLSAVAYRLDQRGFLVRELRAQRQESASLWGELVLHPAHTWNSGWMPARLCWHEETGWSATLHPVGHSGDSHLAVSRYLPAQLVAAPVTVAHFLAALRADTDTVWACGSPRPPRRIDHRLLTLQLARFAMPEPW